MLAVKVHIKFFRAVRFIFVIHPRCQGPFFWFIGAVKVRKPPHTVGVWWGALSVEGRKLDRCSWVIIGFPVSLPSDLVKR